MMGCGHQKFFDIIIFQCLHAFNASAASILAAEVIYGHTFNISKLCHCDHCIFFRDQILCRNIIYIVPNSSPSLITIFIRNQKDFFTYNTEQKISVSKDSLKSSDLFFQFRILCLKFLSFQACKSTKTHINNSLSLHIGKFKPVD